MVNCKRQIFRYENLGAGLHAPEVSVRDAQMQNAFSYYV